MNIRIVYIYLAAVFYEYVSCIYHTSVLYIFPFVFGFSVMVA